MSGGEGVKILVLWMGLVSEHYVSIWDLGPLCLEEPPGRHGVKVAQSGVTVWHQNPGHKSMSGDQNAPQIAAKSHIINRKLSLKIILNS